MDCFHDFCLACDRESTTGPYCSQACRLADLERATPSSPTSPGFRTTTTTTTTSSQQQYHRHHLQQPSGDFLPQAYRFPDPSQSTRPRSPKPQQHQPSRQTTLDSHPPRSLTPSSSRTSLSSTHSTSNSMSEQAKQELQEYCSAFHPTKAAKRRQSTW